MSGVVSAQSEYSVIDLGTNTPLSINEASQIVGVTAGFPQNFFFFSNGQNIQVDPNFRYGAGINDHGQIVGQESSNNDIFLWTPIIPNGDSGSYITFSGSAYDINNHGVVVGSDQNGAFRRDSLGTSYLGTLGGLSSYAYSINNAGQVTGAAWLPFNGVDWPVHAYAYDSSMTDLGTLGGHYSDGSAINNLGHIAGSSNLNGFSYNDVKAIFYNGTMQNIHSHSGFANSFAEGINDLDQVVGTLEDSSGNAHAAFLYHPTTGMRELNALINPASGWSLEWAFDINNCGQIVGLGKLFGGKNLGAT